MSKHINKKAMQNGGFAQYSFDLNDNIGGLPARISLNNTKDGDCNNDSNSNMYSGGSMHRKHRKHSKSHKSKSHKSKSHKSHMTCKSHKSLRSKSHKSHKSRKTRKTRKSHT